MFFIRTFFIRIIAVILNYATIVLGIDLSQSISTMLNFVEVFIFFISIFFIKT